MPEAMEAVRSRLPPEPNVNATVYVVSDFQRKDWTREEEEREEGERGRGVRAPPMGANADKHRWRQQWT